MPDHRKPVIVWFRRDLRLHDNPALAAAAASSRPLLPVYIHGGDSRPEGAASAWWLHHSLEALRSSLRLRGLDLLLRQGRPGPVLAEVAAAAGASAIFFNRAHEPADATLEAGIRAAAPAVDLRSFPGNLLHEPGSITASSGGCFRVFTPFWRACLRAPEPAPPLPPPASRLPSVEMPAGDALADWRLTPQDPDWAQHWSQVWQPGEAGALRALETFTASRMAAYGEARDRADLDGTSRLSPHLHFGEISPRQVWAAVRSTAVEGGTTGAEAFLRELGWREFSAHLLRAAPQMPSAPLRPEFARFPWRQDPRGLAAWQRGTTGYPLVDAGMRELWSTGWMHNRVRMVTASFLVKHLLLDWRLGEAWFWDTLVDADLANNAAGWQWVAGCGTDAAPYFRIFNPVLQGRRFDPQGSYVRRWVPELAGLPDRFLHAPWEAPGPVLAAAGVRIGSTYPPPVVEHRAARERALAAYRRLPRLGVA